MGEVVKLLVDGKPIQKKVPPLPNEMVDLSDIEREFKLFLRLTGLPDSDIVRTTFWAGWNASDEISRDKVYNAGYNEGFSDGLDTR